MSASIRDRWCVRCGIYTPTITHKSMIGEVKKCLKCQHEQIYDEENMSEPMTEKQKKVIQRLLSMGRTYHRLATEAGLKDRPDKFADLSWEQAREIIQAHAGLLGLYR